MLSRVAESIYWMSRYVERAENIARFIDVNSLLNLEVSQPDHQQWSPLVSITGEKEAFVERYGENFSKENVTQFLTFDSEFPNSILSCLNQARENARSIREIIPTEMWESINSFYHDVVTASKVRVAGLGPRKVHDFYKFVKSSCHHFAGVTLVTMPHNEGWHFCRLGRLLERADKTSRILDVKYFMLLPSAADVGTTRDTVQWSYLLRSASGFEAYRQKHGSIRHDWVIDFLVLDREFPRSIQYCLLRAEDSLHAISGSPDGTFINVAEQRSGRLRAELAFMQVEDIVRVGLHEFLDSFQGKLNLLGEGISDTFFALRPVENSFAMMSWESAQ